MTPLAKGTTDPGRPAASAAVGRGGGVSAQRRLPYQAAGRRKPDADERLPAPVAPTDPAARDDVRIVEPILAPRAFETAIEHIVDGMERAHLRPGDRLPSETELSEQLGVSKPT